MPVFSPIKSKVQPKVHSSEYIKMENEPDKADTKPAETVTPAAQPETK